MKRSGLRVNAPQVIHETIDGEVIIINLATGNYYSVKGAGADIWDVVQASPGADAHEIAAAVARRFDNPLDAVEGEIGRFLEELRREELVAEVDQAVPSTSVANGVAATDGARSFETPVLEKYTDMQDLVLLDPVHEVDAAGWPHARPDVATT
ncbi:MAG TPA: PqqD family protein [Gaiellaceae bacterium]|nr:PqqD family protein [Gaiellaceae bacterium]